MKHLVYIGVDDTDVIGGPGTGRVARGMAEYLESLGLGRVKGVIRHQLLVDPRIHYTSHNSAKGIEFETSHPPQDLLQPCIRYLEENFQDGSDPGVCVCSPEQVTDELINYGQRAIIEVILKKDAISLASKNGIILSAVGGTGDGIIGALAAVALSVGGNDGRYVQLQGIREIGGLVTVSELLKTTAITAAIDEKGNVVGEQEIIDSHGWIRPSLISGNPVLRVRLAKDLPGDRVWVPSERGMKNQ